MTSALKVLYETLDFKSGSLLPAIEKPNSSIKHDEWLEKGEWLAAAKRAGVDKIFFVDNNPVAVFAECKSDHIEKVKAFNNIWCLSRPRLLFLASPGELSVIDLAQKPLNVAQVERGGPGRREPLKTLVTLQSISKVAQELQWLHRDHIESGKVFENGRFGPLKVGPLKDRADQALIRDLKIVRRELIQAGLSDEKVKFAHALIGRSIFIRYLEDRGILTIDYFLKVARRTQGWTKILLNQPARSGHDFSKYQSFYPRVLENKEFAYALFKALAKDFNGDMFPNVEEEEQVVTQNHLTLVQSLLYGDVGVQRRLFFYSYRFDIIPLDLISSIYEAFYHSSTERQARDDGAYYTPPVLAEFVLSRTLNAEILKKKPRVLDPACGSGIFLVEAFRRIVRYEWHRNKIRLDFDSLKQILRDQIAGVEVNEEAARITAFSLYLAMLHYLDPPAITEQIRLGNKLPNLLVTGRSSKNHYHCIWVGNTFDQKKIESNKILSNRFGSECADVIVGNPPWGASGKKADIATKDREKVMLKWCAKNEKQIGFLEPSQAFLFRSLDFLSDGGKAGMLVSAGVLFKHGSTSQTFRKQWMSTVKLDEVFNFTHVRSFFFNGAISPFLAVCFTKGEQDNSPVRYWSPKKVKASEETQAVLLSKYDVHVLRDEDLTSSTLWKKYWLGRVADAKFLKYLDAGKRLSDVIEREKCGRGMQAGDGTSSTEDLPSKRLLNIKSFKRYVSSKELEYKVLPKKVAVLGQKDCYHGPRILIKRGIEQKTEPKGQVVSRYEEGRFCFTNAIHGIKLQHSEEWQYKTLLGILWSSLSRYYFFLTSSNWGLWHDENHLEEVFQLPVIFNKKHPSTKKIVAIVDKLRNFNPQEWDVLHPSGVPKGKIDIQRRKWEKELDKAIFKLYAMNDEQKDLIHDCCEVTLPFFYRPSDGVGSESVVQEDDSPWIEAYVHVFSKRWNAYLGTEKEIRAEVHVGAHGDMVAVEFFPSDKCDPWNLKPKHDSWSNILEQIGKALPQPMGISQIVLDGVVHSVSDGGIIIIKRNEKRFWTRSLAREDADATLCKAMRKDREKA